ncbi:probable glycosyltransferase STELLO2 [Lingula anatina]|uniref:Probable glycosyltransferase STELLO2 n=1 Tax=Lingula anatina TaxID=7574 RepID=A0A1S3JBQ2_LINAN|nr:probable glycosyltransferase STELLO2 [Lingula anatina]|eukprot:XP_013407832.1 probable glycosyltransferase STELLO2 [Lingula anatina]
MTRSVVKINSNVIVVVGVIAAGLVLIASLGSKFRPLNVSCQGTTAINVAGGLVSGGTADFGATSGRRFQMKRVRDFEKDKRVGYRPPSTCTDYHKKPPATPCKKWVVITTIFEPSELVKQLSEITSWCVVVVADKKGPEKYVVPNVKYLSVLEQESCQFHICKLLIWNHFGRKNIGYMYAIHHGAEYIYDTDDDNVLRRAKIPDPAKIKGVKNINMKGTVWNPYPMMSKYPDSWPRGFPLEKIKSKEAKTQSFTDELPLGKIGIIQSLADNEPDVDAIYRFTQPLPFDFHHKELYVAVPQGVMTPYNAQATMTMYDAFFSTYLPVTVKGRVSDIWRSYFNVRLFWYIERSLVFSAPWVVQYRNAHNWLADFDSENDLYMRAAQLVEYLTNWKSSEKDIASMSIELYKEMYNHQVLQIDDVYNIEAWFKDLECLGYKFPAIVSKE